MEAIVWLVIFGFLGLGAIAIVFYFSAYFVPIAIGATLGSIAHYSGAGSIGGVIIFIVTSVGSFFLFKNLFERFQYSKWAVAVIVVYVTPPMVIMFMVLYHYLPTDVVSVWRVVFSSAGSLLIGGICYLALNGES